MTAGADADSADDWEHHWGEYASTAVDNPAQAYRRRLVIGLLATNGQPRRLLDIGSGQGDLLAALALAWPDAELTGLELSATGVARGMTKVPRARFIQRNLLESGDPPRDRVGWATHAVCSEVLEHVDDPVLLLANAKPYLGRGCRIVITVPGGPRSAFDKHIGHRQHFTRKSVTNLLETAGLRVAQTMAAGFPTFNAYKLLVIARGKRLIDDVKADDSGRSPRVAKLAMDMFDPMFRIARPNSRWGWQLIAVATYPG